MSSTTHAATITATATGTIWWWLTGMSSVNALSTVASARAPTAAHIHGCSHRAVSEAARPDALVPADAGRATTPPLYSQPSGRGSASERVRSLGGTKRGQQLVAGRTLGHERVGSGRQRGGAQLHGEAVGDDPDAGPAGFD